MMVWEAIITGFGGGFILLKGSGRVGEICVGDDELGFELGMGNGPAEQEKEKWGRKWKSGKSFGAGMSSPPLAHEPGLPQELQRQKKNSQLIVSCPSPLGNSASSSSCVH